MELGTVRVSCLWTFGGGAQGGAGELQNLLFRQPRLKATAAACFIGSAGAHDNEVFRVHQALRVFRRIPAAHADCQHFGDGFGQCEQIGHRRKGPPEVVGVEAGDDYLFAAIGQLLSDFHQALSKEVGFVYANHFRAPVELGEDLRHIPNDFRFHPHIAMRDDLIEGIADVDGGFESLDSFAGNARAAQAADELFALTGEHGAADGLNPTGMTCEYVHAVLSSVTPASDANATVILEEGEARLSAGRNLLVTDFDGTVTKHDFYELALARVARSEASADYWSLYASGRITHFEAMRGIFGCIRCDDAAMAEVLASMEPDPRMAEMVARLRAAGWDVMVVSAGSSWYIHRVLQAAGVDVPVHASPGRFSPSEGLVMELPLDSPFLCPTMGIDKEAAVLYGQREYEQVAFAGNGPPDLKPALRVKPELRFARTYLAAELKRRGEGFVPFERWSEVALRLLA
jgi:2-hydroxy-3-keto-5-methylthiopentenyl-1-phosphate phosphatase